MKMIFRWSAGNDIVPLEYISQIPGMTGICSADYEVAAGEEWRLEDLLKIRRECEKNGLEFEVIESIPVCEEIKLGTPDRDKFIDLFCKDMRVCAEAGIKVVCYNFMPVFDWTRTNLKYKNKDGSTSLAMFFEDLKTLNPAEGDLSLPGWNDSYTKAEIRSLIDAYKAIGEEGLWDNLEYFLKKVIPVAEEVGIRLAIHPDDPPYPIFGLPRIITCEENLDRMFSLVPSIANGLTLCTGSLGCSKKNDMVKLAAKYAAQGRIHFAHLRNVHIEDDGSFEECGHRTEGGSVDMYGVVKALVENGFDGYVRPDHGRNIWGEDGKPGYGLYDRALGAVYLGGLFEAIEKDGK